MEPTIPERTHVEELVRKVQLLEREIEVEFAKRRAGLRYGIERGKIIFEEEILRRHRELKVGLFAYIADAKLVVVFTVPVIYAPIIALVLLDLLVSIYQAVCFPVYGIPKVKRSEYFFYDRGGLAYLNLIQKINCAYCSYANGLIGYVREIGGRTEAHWCPIKHARRVIGAHQYYGAFADFGDAEEFRNHRQADSKKDTEEHKDNSREEKRETVGH